MPPGFTVTSAAATVVETLKLLLSAICTWPPAVILLGFISDSAKVKGNDGSPATDLTAAWSAASGPGTSPWKIQRFCSGMFLNASAGTPTFFARTSGCVCASQSVGSNVLYSDERA